MFERIQDARSEFLRLFIPEWINLLYLATIIFGILFVLEIKNIKRWQELDEDDQRRIKIDIWGFTIGVIGSMMSLLGYI